MPPPDRETAPAGAAPIPSTRRPSQKVHGEDSRQVGSEWLTLEFEAIAGLIDTLWSDTQTGNIVARLNLQYAARHLAQTQTELVAAVEAIR